MPIELKSDKVVMVDCDDTLLMWDVSEYPDLSRVSFEYGGWPTILAENQKNINLVVKLAKLGYTIVVWSQSGHGWAKRVSQAVGLDSVVSLYMSKPRYHIDDLPSSVWMGERLWRHPITGESE